MVHSQVSLLGLLAAEPISFHPSQEVILCELSFCLRPVRVGAVCCQDYQAYNEGSAGRAINLMKKEMLEKE